MGTPMGSPVSVVIAEIVMQDIEKQIMNNNDSIFFWYHFVDDIIACIPRNEVQVLLQSINSINPNIQFTFEMEENNQINFLDMTIIRSPIGKLSFKIYRKPTHTDKYLSYHSSHPINHKESVVKSLLSRKENLCDDQYKKEEENHIYTVLKYNNYPIDFINKIN